MEKFKRSIPFILAVRSVVGLNVAVLIFHLLVLLQVVPMNVIWGGRLESENEMYVFESVSILVNVLLILVVIAKRKAIRQATRHTTINVVLWIFTALFVLNTLGNLVAKSSVETLVATPLTFLLAVLTFRLAIEKPWRSG